MAHAFFSQRASPHINKCTLMMEEVFQNVLVYFSFGHMGESVHEVQELVSEVASMIMLILGGVRSLWGSRLYSST